MVFRCSSVNMSLTRTCRCNFLSGTKEYSTIKVVSKMNHLLYQKFATTDLTLSNDKKVVSTKIMFTSPRPVQFPGTTYRDDLSPEILGKVINISTST